MWLAASLVNLNLGYDAVVAKVKQAPSVAFNLDTRDLADLKSAGVSGRVIAAWHLNAEADLKPGEYALYADPIQIWDFGVD